MGVEILSALSGFDDHEGITCFQKMVWPVALRNDVLVNGYGYPFGRQNQNIVNHLLQGAKFGHGICLLIYGNFHPVQILKTLGMGPSEDWQTTIDYRCLTFPFGSTNCIRFKGYFSAQGTPKVFCKSIKYFGIR
jgi:hypothetical protein